MPASTDILISGAGAAGLTLAIDLARRGVAFRLIDKAPGPFIGSRGKGLQPRSLEVFEDLGVLQGLIARGAAPYPLVRAWRDDGFEDAPIGEGHAPTPAEPYAQPLMLPQFLTEAVLRERLAELGAAPEFGSELVGFEETPTGVLARIRSQDGETAVLARYLVGSDGGRSFVRATLGIAFEGQTLPIRGLVADVEVDGLDRDVWHRWGGGTSDQVALCPLAGTDLFQLQAVLPTAGEPDTSDEALRRLVAERTGRHDIRLGAVRWRSAFSVNARLADRYRVGRVFLAGDAAHVHPPTGGQGLNTSLQDAYNLGWKLAAVLDGGPEPLLDTYDAERRPVAAGVLGLSVGLLEAERRKAPMRRGREAHELDLSYAGSPLAQDGRTQPGRVEAGDRAPDAPCRRSDGQAVRLFDLFRGPCWTLLSWDAPAPPPAAGVGMLVVGEDLIDDKGHIQAAYDLTSPTWVLVRPDGYVGAMLPAGEQAALKAYLAAVGVQAVAVA